MTFYSSGQDVGGDLQTWDGTTENAVCNNRGLCDPYSGFCKCFKGFYSSDGAGRGGSLNDCGHVLDRPPPFYGNYTFKRLVNETALPSPVPTPAPSATLVVTNCTDASYSNGFMSITTERNNTNSAQQHTSSCCFNANAGTTLTFSFCRPGASFTSDTYIRLYNSSESQVAVNDDYCGLGSALSYSIAATGSHCIRVGCFEALPCSGVMFMG